MIFSFENYLSPEATDTGNVNKILSATEIFGKVNVKLFSNTYCNTDIGSNSVSVDIGK